MLWANDPAGPWSDPTKLGVHGVFDPLHVVGQQSNRYLYVNQGMMIRLLPFGLSATWPHPPTRPRGRVLYT